MRRIYLVTVCAAFMLSYSCGGVRQAIGSLKDLQAVQAHIAAVAKNDNVRVFLNNGHYLSVSIMNSPWKDLPSDPKKAKALEIARLAYGDYASRSALESVTVNFGVHQTFGIASYDNSGEVFTFAAAELAGEPARTSNR